ncbi:MAG: hypothetical protein AAFR04_09420 [Pseudomonadota bacterium]
MQARRCDARFAFIFHRVAAALFAIVVPLAAMASHARADASPSLAALAKELCFDKLYDVAASEKRLTALGWRPLELTGGPSPFRHPITAVFFHGIKSDRGIVFESPDRTALLVHGQAHNKHFPNMKCYLASSQADANVEALTRHANRLFAPLQGKVTTIPRAGITLRKWQLNSYARNISPTAPFNTVSIDRYANPTSTRRLRLLITVVGMLAK